MGALKTSVKINVFCVRLGPSFPECLSTAESYVP